MSVKPECPECNSNSIYHVANPKPNSDNVKETFECNDCGYESKSKFDFIKSEMNND